MTDDLPEVRKGHPYVMHDMLRSVSSSIAKVSEYMKNFDAGIMKGNLNFTGNGTAFHSAEVGSYFLRETDRPSCCIQAYELENYGNADGTLVAVSHSGKTKSTLDAMLKYKKKAVTIGITHDADSPISRESDYSVVLPGRDLSLCNTKAFFDNALAVMHMSSAYSAFNPGLDKIESDIVKVISSCEGSAKEIISNMPTPEHMYVLGAGPNYYGAREAAQKIKEAAHIPAEGIELEEFNHGCTAVMTEKTAIVLLCNPTVDERAMEIIRASRHVGSPTLTINGEGDYNVDIMEPESENFSPLYNMGPLYFLAYYLALKVGVNPDLLRFEDPRYRAYDNEVFPPGTH
ncbi:MAG: SIS domain-containing protein [Candidatus Thermoplasmatota archaeon]|jgi:glucosamine--fructose-6-phosphate aminotransferase (isomerizing)|nr:SIS domain-containing protein [Candidatus Thermoplasmatota archaeon]MCL5794690.1 SIS domain-containing protein [Candidatus Thermoplasmatota archaeon]